MMSATIKAMRLILYTLGFVSMFLVMFMAQRLETRFQSLEARLLEMSFTEPKRPGLVNKVADTSAAIMEKAKKFKEYASNAEAILESMERTRREEEDLALSGLTMSHQRVIVLNGDGSARELIIGEGTNSSFKYEESFAAAAARAAQKAKEDANRKYEMDLQKMEKNHAAREAAAELAQEKAMLEDARLADESQEEMANQLEAEPATGGGGADSTPHIFAASSGTEDYGDVVLVVIISNRRDGIIPTVASILTTSSKPVDVILIGEHEINEQVRDHFGDRIHSFTSMSVKDVEDDLVAQGLTPIWTWPEWHTSMDPSWRNENTLHVGSWDNLMTHAHVLNHIRFYLPLCTIFRGRPYFYFLDDDIMVQRDLGVLAERTMGDLPPERGLVCACNIWMWNSDCFHFEFQSKKDYILDMPSLYGDREVCQTESESHCVPANYWDWVHTQIPVKGGENQYAWNFGFSLFGIDNWIANNLTEKYESVMHASYDNHVFPETSLTFGLGVSYIAFAGAVECWNEEYVQVRDGFGFIEWDRYAKTFGDDFFNFVDVVHYTGPDKPWVDESRIEERAIVPWLKMMEHEGMPIPKQLPLTPTDNLFLLLGGDRTGAQWIMSVLDAHPQVCASGEADKPETGFSADVLLPSGLPWYPYCSIKRGCSLEFYKTEIGKLTANVTADGTPLRCLEAYDPIKNSDELLDHLPRMCNVIQRLEGNFDDGSIAKVWMEGFLSEDRSITGCGCVRGVKAKGLKVLAEWITYRGYPEERIEEPMVNLNKTAAVGSKIIRLKRRNTWARYKSMMTAVATERYHPLNIGEKKDQLGLLEPMDIDVHHMEWNINNFQQVDRAGDEWAKQHASEILWLYYEDCRADTAGCFEKIYEFIGVDPGHVTGKQKALYQSSFAEMDGIDATLDYVNNRGEIFETLGGNGWGHMIAGETYTPVQFMLYHEDDMFIRTQQMTGVNTILFGNDVNAEGHGNKFTAVKPYLRNMPPYALVILSDDRDAWTNFPVTEQSQYFDSLRLFREKFAKLVEGKEGAVVASAEVECCATALTHADPGAFVQASGQRVARACLSGEPNCMWGSNDKATVWRNFMIDLASQRTSSGTKRAFLDGSLLVGRAAELLQLIEQLDIASTEDDRAVLTDYMYHFPDKIVLDYDQIIIGQAREGPADIGRNKACPAWHKENNVAAVEEFRRLDHLSEATFENRPLFVFSPRYHGCDETKKTLPEAYPTWGDSGIDLDAIMNHVDRVVNAEESIVLLPVYGRIPDYRQGPELPYIVDEDGMWSSNLIRNRTEEATMTWRLAPTEESLLDAHSLLMDEINNNPDYPRWPALRENIKNGNGFFYWAWYGDYKTCNYKNRDEDSVPIFTTCATRFCDHAFPVPNYMNIIDTQGSPANWRGVFQEFNTQFPWSSKISKIIWRGALSEAEWRDALTSVRWRANKLITELNLGGATHYDVGLTGIPRWLTTRVKFNTTEVGGFLKGLSPMTAFMQYKAILDMDGNSWSSRFGTLLCYNSVVVKIEPKYFEYFYPELKPWKHFIPVKNDLSDLDQNVRWAVDPKNEKAVLDIIESANQWCSQRILNQELARDQVDIWESYVRQLNRGDAAWTKKWAQHKKSLFEREDFNVINIDPKTPKNATQ